MELELRINGVVKDVSATANESLLTLLRRNGYTSVKQGCETGECGACTVLVDGVPRTTCSMLATQAGGCALTTVEGLQNGHDLHVLHPLQQAFIGMNATQCGFCIPGMLLSAAALLSRQPNPTEDDVRDALSGNLCRCMGYEKPVQAVLLAASILRGEVPADFGNVNGPILNGARVTGRQRAMVLDSINGITEKTRATTPATPFIGVGNSPFSVLGKSMQAIDAVKMVTGRATFTNDTSIKGVLCGKVLTSPHAHAIIRRIDVSRARAISGVYAVLTYQDIQRIPFASGNEASPQDRYSLDYIVRFVGDRVAAVAAETPELAQQALASIEVEYDVLPALLDPRQTLDAKNIQLHTESESRNIYSAERNVANRTHIETGDVGRGFGESELVIDGEYVLPATRQAALETRSVLTYFDEDGYLVVRCNAYTPFHVRRVLASILGIPPHRIRVEQSALAGAPAVQQSIQHEDICALLTQATSRPVQLVQSRAEEMLESGAYPQHIVRMKTGVKRDGTLVANQMVVLVGTGAYGSYAPTVSDVLKSYPCTHTRFVTEVLYTNYAPASNTSAYNAEMFALESHMDEIAKQLGMDALALRRKNWGYSDTQEHAESSVPECMQLVETKLQWSTKRAQVWNSRLHRGVGVAYTRYENAHSEPESSAALIKLNEDGSFDVFLNVADAALKTVMAQIGAEVLGISVERILLHTSPTDSVPFAITTNVASTLYIAGTALRRAAELMRRQILTTASRMLNTLPEALTIQNGVITPSPLNGQTLTFEQVASALLVNEGRQLVVSAPWNESRSAVAHAVHGAEVEVDTETGAVRVIRLLAALDAGRVLHPALAEAQVQGAMAQGLGLGISEEVWYDIQGQVLTSTFSDYHLFNAAEMPELQIYLLQNEAASQGVFGAKSVVEVAQNGVAPAVANAIADAIGLRIRQLPFTPERILRAIHNAKRQS